MAVALTAPEEQEVLKKNDGTDGKPLLICYVCTGNTCRSPMAAAVTNALEAERRATLPAALQGLLPRPLRADSRGLFAEEGAPISDGALHALEEAGVSPIPGELDYREHCSRTVTEADAAAFDVLCAISRRHAMELLLRFPQYAKKIFCLPQDVADPYGGDDALYRASLEQITRCVRAMWFSADGEGEA